MTTKRKLWGTDDIALRDLAGSWADSLESACGWRVNRSMITTVEHGFTDAHYEFLDRYDD